MAVAIAALLRGDPLVRALDSADEQLNGREGYEEVANALAAGRALAARGQPRPEDLETLGGGWVTALITPIRANMVGSTAIGDEHERLDRGLPFRQIRFLLWQIGDVGRRVLQRQQLPAIRQRDRIIEAGAPGH